MSCPTASGMHKLLVGGCDRQKRFMAAVRLVSATFLSCSTPEEAQRAKCCVIRIYCSTTNILTMHTLTGAVHMYLEQKVSLLLY